MNLPSDPVMMMSVVNTLLRDKYDSPAELCRAEDLEYEDVAGTLKKAGYIYNEEANQFKEGFCYED